MTTGSTPMPTSGRASVRIKVRDLSPEVILAWQRDLLAGVDTKRGKPLSANTVRLARASLAGALKLAVKSRVLFSNPLAEVERPKPKRSVPKHWSPEQAASVPPVPGRRPALPALGVPARLRRADRRAGLAAVGQRRPRPPPGPHRRVRHHPRLRARRVRGQERHVTPDRGPRRRAGRACCVDSESSSASRPGALATCAADYVFTKPAGGSYHPQDLSKTLAERSRSRPVCRD